MTLPTKRVKYIKPKTLTWNILVTSCIFWSINSSNLPKPAQLTKNTATVIAMVLIVAILVFILDFAFETLNSKGVEGLKKLVNNNSVTENISTDNNIVDNTAVENEDNTTVEGADENNTTTEENQTENTASEEDASNEENNQ